MPTPERIIVIDDNANDVQVIRRFLERKGYTVDTATSGEAGLELASRITPDAFVVDYRMPGMDGFELTRRIKSDPQLQTIPILLLTGADAARSVVEGLATGADDYVTKSSDTAVLLARLRALLRVKRYQDQLRNLNQQITRDLQIARRVQEALVPRGTFCAPQMEIRSSYIPSEVLSGDFYDYFSQDNFVYLFVADVSGHGLPAAILVSLLKSYIHTEAESGTRLSDLMASLNDFLYTVSLPTQFATAQLFRVDGEGNVAYANAAHPPFLLLHRDCGRAILHEEPSPLLGAMPAMQYAERSLRVSPGDTMFAYTDGLTDRRTESGEFYSIDRVAALLEAQRDADLGSIYQAIDDDVREFPATGEFKDDIAFVVTRFH